MAKHVNTAHHVDFETVVPAGSPLGSAIVVKGKARTYLFGSDSTLTRTEEHVVVRAYNGIFVYKLTAVEARRLSVKDPLDLTALPQERDAELRKTITHARADAPRPAADVCPDCVIPVVAGS